MNRRHFADIVSSPRQPSVRFSATLTQTPWQPLFQLAVVAMPREVFRQALEHIGGLHLASG